MGARGSGRVVVSPWDRLRAVAGHRGDKGKKNGHNGQHEAAAGRAQRRDTTVLWHGLASKPFEGEVVCASMDVNIWIRGHVIAS